jgi:hypothetical protein
MAKHASSGYPPATASIYKILSGISGLSMGNAPSSTAHGHRTHKSTSKSTAERDTTLLTLEELLRRIAFPSNKDKPVRAGDVLTPGKSEVAYAPPNTDDPQDGATPAFQIFLKAFPEYQYTWILDTLRRTDFTRLDKTGETYVDFMGGAIYPESLLRIHTSFLNTSVLGNTHSVSNR